MNGFTRAAFVTAAVLFSTRSQLLAEPPRAAADGLVRHWDAKTDREFSAPEGYLGPRPPPGPYAFSVPAPQAAYSPDGRLVAVADASGQVDLWDATTGKRLRVVRREGLRVTHLAFAPDSQSLAAGHGFGGSVQLWDVPSGRHGRVFRWETKKYERFLRTMLFSPDGRYLYVGDGERETRLWEVATGEVCWRDSPNLAAAFSPDGATIATATREGLSLASSHVTAGSKDRQVRLRWGSGSFEEVQAIAFSPDSRRLAVGHEKGRISVWDPRGSFEVRHFQAVDLKDGGLALYGAVRNLAFSPDGKWLISGGTDAVVRVWEVVTGKQVLRLNGHQAEVSTVAFGGDGRTVLSCGEDTHIYLWDLRPQSAAAPKRALESLWADLGAAEPEKSYAAVWALSVDAGATSRFLRERIAPVTPVDKDRLTKALADLDSSRFSVRAAASRAIAELGELATPALEEALKTAPSLEARKRLQALLDLTNREPTLPDLRRLRAVQALELAGTAETRAVLGAWGNGAAGARLTEDAKAALARLEKRDRLRRIK